MLDRPIFLVGCSKSGTSILGLIFSYHPKVGPKNRSQGDYRSLAEFSCALLEDRVQDRVAHQMEEKAVWDITATKEMVPSHKSITETEEKLSSIASKFGGEADGWGCFRVVDEDSDS